MNKIQKIKQHVKNNKAVYITGGVCLAVGALGGGAYILTRPEASFLQKATIIGWKNTSVQLQFVERSTPSKPIHLKGTKQYFDSISAAARETGLDRAQISRNINGHIPDVAGSVFEMIDVSA